MTLLVASDLMVRYKYCIIVLQIVFFRRCSNSNSCRAFSEYGPFHFNIYNGPGKFRPTDGTAGWQVKVLQVLREQPLQGFAWVTYTHSL
jgi:hypothetical protein